MSFAVLMVAVAAAVDARASSEHVREVLLAVNEEAGASAAPQAAPGGDSKISHTPLEKTPRGENVSLQARIQDPSKLFAPLVFVRKTGTSRYEAFTMQDRGRGNFRARLPASILSEGSFEYFVEAQHEEGAASRSGSPRKPFTCVAYDPPPQPVALSIRTAEPGASVRIDDNQAGKTPLTVRLLPGRHTLSITSVDGRTTEQQIDLKPGKKMDLPVDLPRQAGGPATLSVTSDPLEANVLVDGAVVGRSPYQGVLQPGEHTVAVELEGHQRRERKVSAREGRDASISFVLSALPKRPALSVESDPVGAQVLVDGKERGRTPLIVALPPGKHEVVLHKEGRRDLATEIDMPAEQDLSIRLDLAVAVRSGSRLTVTSTPVGASVTLDGGDVGVTPWSAETRPGKHKVSINAVGYVKDERLVQIQMDRDTVVDFAPRRMPGAARLSVETEPPAQVRVDGKELGVSPLSAEVQPGEHQLEITLDGYKTVAQQVAIDAGQGLSVRIPMQRAQAQEPPLIAVSSDPAGAQIFLDGKLAGATPLKVRTTPGPHEVRLSLDGYVPRVTRPVLPPDRDFELRIAVVLTPVRGGEKQRRPPTADELFRAQVAAAHACSVKGDLECALAGYRTAYGQRQHPLVLFNIAQVRRKLGRYDEAAGTYRDFLAQAQKAKGSAAPQKELVAEARLQLAFCESQLLPKLPLPLATAPAAPPLLPPAEDTTPPRLQHVPILTARRSLPLRLVATVTDDRSGVLVARACWRNAYERDFECHPMGNIGGDDYGIEVPARSITDYFAYYLEAFDNAENGPTRSGAPELPHAVTVDDPPQAMVTPGVEVAVASPPSGELRFASLPYPPMVVQQPPGQTSPYGAGAPNAQQAWNVTLFLGGERSHEEYTDSVVLGRLGLEGTRHFAGNWMAAATFDWRSSQQQYAALNGPPGSRTTVDENRFDFAGLAGYDLADLIGMADRLELMPIAGGTAILARNDGFSFNVLGPSVGLRASWAFSPVTLLLTGAYTYNLDRDSSASSSSGAALSAWGLRAGVQFRFNPATTLELDYVGDAIKFENDVRVGHGAVFGFSKSF